jgi:hypothetical protein
MRKIIVITIQRIPFMTAMSLEMTPRLRESMMILLCKKKSWELSKTAFVSFATRIPTSQYDLVVALTTFGNLYLSVEFGCEYNAFGCRTL